MLQRVKNVVLLEPKKGHEAIKFYMEGILQLYCGEHEDDKEKNLKKTDHADKKDEQVLHQLHLTVLQKTTNSEICSYSVVQ